MTILEMIATWRSGCSCSTSIAKDGAVTKLAPWVCQECTEGLIDAIEGRVKGNHGLIEAADKALQSTLDEHRERIEQILREHPEED
jgi:hypothetical protein